jgi:hypothetical protein
LLLISGAMSLWGACLKDDERAGIAAVATGNLWRGRKLDAR